ncbi:MAG TPA: hypothetical protein PLJ27_25850, partial [Polyangiaceae bacterium]|nr:hypothetical protein [Polyangiaceae bacterium]
VSQKGRAACAAAAVGAMSSHRGYAAPFVSPFRLSMGSFLSGFVAPDDPLARTRDLICLLPPCPSE